MTQRPYDTFDRSSHQEERQKRNKRINASVCVCEAKAMLYAICVWGGRGRWVRGGRKRRSRKGSVFHTLTRLWRLAIVSFEIWNVKKYFHHCNWPFSQSLLFTPVRLIQVCAGLEKTYIKLFSGDTVAKWPKAPRHKPRDPLFESDRRSFPDHPSLSPPLISCHSLPSYHNKGKKNPKSI